MEAFVQSFSSQKNDSLVVKASERRDTRINPVRMHNFPFHQTHCIDDYRSISMSSDGSSMSISFPDSQTHGELAMIIVIAIATSRYSDRFSPRVTSIIIDIDDYR
jgi:hypothetical protein